MNSADRFTTSNLIISGQAANCSVIGDDELKSTPKQFWETESIGIREPEDPSVTQLSDSFLKNINDEGNRYEVSLPWKEETDCNLLDVPTDYNYCYNRLKSLQHKLRKEPELLKGYNSTINDQLKMGVIEEVPREEVERVVNKASGEKRPIHYMPDHAVVRKDKDTTKLRVVYDGSAKSESERRSLNEF